MQCRGKILLKVMRYNIALLPKKVTNYVTKLLFMKSNALCYFFNLGRACMFVFNIKKSYIFGKYKSFHTKRVMNTPQAEGKVNSRLYSRMQKKTFQHFSNKN